MPKVALDRRRLLGFRLEQPSRKAAAPPVKTGAKIGAKIGHKHPKPQV